MNTPLPPETLQSIKELLSQGRKIEAVKDYRNAISTSLADAKAAVDQMEAELKVAQPESIKPQNVPQMIGCASGCGVLLVGAVAGVLLWANRVGDAGLENRMGPVLNSVLLVMVTLQFCVQVLNRRKAFAWLSLAVLIFLLGAIIFSAFKH